MADPGSQAGQTLGNKELSTHAPEKSPTPCSAKDRFFDARDLVQVKYEMLRRVRPTSIGDQRGGPFGFSRPSFYQALSAFQQDGLGGLVSHKRGPKQAHKLTDDVMAFIVDQRQKEPSVRPTELSRLCRNTSARPCIREVSSAAYSAIKKNAAEGAFWPTRNSSRSDCPLRATPARRRWVPFSGRRRFGLGAFSPARNDGLDAGLVAMHRRVAPNPHPQPATPTAVPMDLQKTDRRAAGGNHSQSATGGKP